MHIALVQAEERLSCYPGYGTYGPGVHMLEWLGFATGKQEKQKDEQRRRSATFLALQERIQKNISEGRGVTDKQPKKKKKKEEEMISLGSRASMATPTPPLGPRWTWKALAQETIRHMKSTSCGPEVQCCRPHARTHCSFCHDIPEGKSEPECKHVQRNWHRLIAAANMARWVLNVAVDEFADRVERGDEEDGIFIFTCGLAFGKGSILAAEERVKEKQKMKQAVAIAAEKTVQKSIHELQEQGALAQWNSKEFLGRRRTTRGKAD